MMMTQTLIGFASRPFRDTPPCGDGWCHHEAGHIYRLMLADGMGHGVHAHLVVKQLQQQMRWLCDRDTQLISLSDCLENLHRSLKQQGSDSQAAVALLDVDQRNHQLHVVSVGNIQVLYQAASGGFCFPSLRGMVGGRFPSQLAVSCWQLEPRSLLALISDGIASHAAREYLKGLYDRSTHQQLQIQNEAEHVVIQFGKLSDDASCILLQHGEPAA